MLFHCSTKKVKERMNRNRSSTGKKISLLGKKSFFSKEVHFEV